MKSLEYLLVSFPLTKKKAWKNWHKRRYALPNIYAYKINLRLSKEWSRSFLYINAIASWSCWVGEFPTNIFEVYFRARCQHISKYLHKTNQQVKLVMKYEIAYCIYWVITFMRWKSFFFKLLKDFAFRFTVVFNSLLMSFNFNFR